MRPTWAEVDLRQLASNYQAVRAHVRPETKIMAVVKADAYGHGGAEVASRLEAMGADCFGVATVQEAVTLRRAGIRNPILILGGFWSGEEEAIIHHDLTPAVCRLDALVALAREARFHGRTIAYHLEIDSGMSRLGVHPDEAVEFVRRAQDLGNVALEGVFTHFASADEQDADFTRRQIALFEKTVRQIENAGFRITYRHAANSAGLLFYPESWFDMVRPGIVLYGYPPGGRGAGAPIAPVLSLKTRIVSLRRVPAGTPVGYGRTFVAQRQSLIATLPIGYGDGLSRLLSNRGKVIVRDRFAPIVGLISMDATTIDVTDVPGVEIDDEVIIIGRSGSLQITADDIARQINTIPYEVLCGIGKRVPRIYIE